MTELTMWHQLGAAFVGAAVVGNFLINLIRSGMAERRLGSIEKIFSDIVQRIVVLETRLSEHSERHHSEFTQFDNRMISLNDKVNENQKETLKVLSDIRDRIARMEGK